MKDEEHLIYCGPHLKSGRTLGKFRINRTVSLCSLIIMGVSTEDAGSYSCIVYLPEQSSTGFVRATSNDFILDPVSQTWHLAVGVIVLAIILIAQVVINGFVCYYRRKRRPEEQHLLNGNRGDNNFISTLACTVCTCSYLPDANAYGECKWECIIYYYLRNLREFFQALAELLQTKLHPELQIDSLCSQTNRLRYWLCDS